MSNPVRRKGTVSLPAYGGSSGDNIIQNYATYEDYLDNQISSTDLFYLEDLDLARQLVELGYRSNAEIMTREQFNYLKEAAEQARLQALQKIPKKMFSAGKDLEGFPFLKALAEREHDVRHGTLAVSFLRHHIIAQTIIFIRDVNQKGLEISGYIDYGDRLKNNDMELVFDRKTRLLPMPHDLSYYNWLNAGLH